MEPCSLSYQPYPAGPMASPPPPFAEGQQNVFTCEICNVTCSSEVVYQGHLAGKKHMNNMKKINEKVISPLLNPLGTRECHNCNLKFSSEDQYNTHVSGVKHTKRMARLEIDKLKAEKDESVYCQICELLLDPELMKLHREGGKHKRKMNGLGGNEPSPKKPKKERAKNLFDLIEEKMTTRHCGICSVDFNTDSHSIMHYHNKKHISLVATNLQEQSPFYCAKCKVGSATEEVFKMHLNGFNHQWKESNGTLDPEGPFKVQIEKKIKMKDRMIRSFLNKIPNEQQEIPLNQE